MNKFKYDTVVFDLLTGLINSWSLWNEVAECQKMGHKWRSRYLELTYNTFKYKKYEYLVLLAAKDVGLNTKLAKNLFKKWKSLRPWSETNEVLKLISQKYLIGFATNCSIKKGEEAMNAIDINFNYYVTAEEVGYYKPHPSIYKKILEKMKTTPSRTLFVAGSPFDVRGAKNIGMNVYWHNRIGLDYKNTNADHVEVSLYKLLEILDL